MDIGTENMKKTILITVRSAWTASEWTHILYLISQNHTEWLGLEGTCGHHLEQSHAKAGSPRADCTGLCPGGFWVSAEKETPSPSSPGNISLTTCLCSLFWCSVTLKLKFFLIFRWNFLCFSFHQFPCILSLGTSEQRLVPSSGYPSLRYLYALIRSLHTHLLSSINSWALSFAFHMLSHCLLEMQ